MAANRSAFILSEVRTALAAETSFTVVNIDRPNNGDAVQVYPFILSQATRETLEDGAGDSTGVAIVNILFDVPVNADANDTGTATVSYGDVVQKCENALADWETTITSTPPKDTHTGGLFKTTITGLRVQGWDGLYDKGQTSYVTACTIEVYYTHIAL